MKDRQTDGQKDRQTDARGKTICLPTLKGGGGGDIILREASWGTSTFQNISHLNAIGCKFDLDVKQVKVNL